MRNAAVLVLFSSLASAAAPPPPPPITPSAPPMVRSENTSVWPGNGSFGLRVGWGGGTATAGVDVGNVGLKYLINDNLALVADVGLGITGSRIGSGASFALDGGVLIYLRTPGVALRPYFPIMGGVGLINTQSVPMGVNDRVYSYSSFHLAFAAGVGAEFWLARWFSVAGELLLRLQVSNFDPVVVEFGTLSPGIHATFYF